MNTHKERKDKKEKCKHIEDVSWGSLALAMSGKGQYKRCGKCKKMFDSRSGETVTNKQIWE